MHAKTFIAIYGIKSGVGLVTSLVNREIFRNQNILMKIVGKDSASLALFLSSFTSVFKVVSCILQRVRKTSDVISK